MAVELHELAEHMRDERWLDMRYDDELLQRVRIVEMVVRLDGEEIVLKQEWVNEAAEMDEDYFHRQRIVLDSEGIWKVKPTVYQIGDVRPHGAPPPPREKQSEEFQQRVAVTTINSARALWGLTLEELRNTKSWDGIPYRYACMIVLYEASDLRDRQITEMVGYDSMQPLVSARCTASPHPRAPQHEVDENRRKMMKALASSVDEQFDEPPRTTRAFPRDYRPLLLVPRR